MNIITSGINGGSISLRLSFSQSNPVNQGWEVNRLKPCLPTPIRAFTSLVNRDLIKSMAWADTLC